MGEDKQKLIVGLLIVNLVLTGYYGMTLTKNLKAQNDLFSNQMNNFTNTLYNMEYNISNGIQSALDARDNRIDKAEYKFATIDTENKTVTLDLNVNLKAVSPNSRIFLAYNERDANTVQELELVKKEGLAYYASIELDLDKNYEYDVIERVDGGGEVILNANKQYLNINDEFYAQRVQLLHSGSGRSGERIDLNSTFSVDDFGMESLGLDTVFLEVLYEGEIIDTLNITERIVYTDDASLLERYNEAIASVIIESSVKIDEFGKSIGYISEQNNDNKTYYSYNFSVDYVADYPELKFDFEKAENIYFNLVINCKDGYQWGVTQ